MSPALIACMGGFCRHRDNCGHYHAEDRREPAENLCRDEGGSQWVPINFQRREELKEAA